jgi:hypothetical protein
MDVHSEKKIDQFMRHNEGSNGSTGERSKPIR